MFTHLFAPANLKAAGPANSISVVERLDNQVAQGLEPPHL